MNAVRRAVFLRAVFLLAVAFCLAASGLAASGAGAAAGGVNVTVSGSCSGEPFCFTASTVTIPAGGTVTWTNETGDGHTVTRCDPAACDGVSGGDGTDRGFTSGNLPETGSTFSHTFTGAGTYTYYCAFHGYAVMHGTVVVTAAPTTTTATTSTTTASPSDGVTTTSTTVGVAAAAGPTTPAAQLAHTGGAPTLPIAAGIACIAIGLALFAVPGGRGVRRRTSSP